MTWTRIQDGYASSDAAWQLLDNGAGLGPAKGSKRWAVMHNGAWQANVDTLAEAKQYAQDNRREDVGAKSGYADGVEYGRVTALRMSVERRRDNDRYVRGAEWLAQGSPTRAFWLGFRRAMRGTA